jgi:transposase
MQVVHLRCAGLDVHQKTVVACVLAAAGPQQRVSRVVRTFGTMTADLAALAAWLVEQQVEQVALESTGVYWWPVFNLLEEAGLGVTLVNPQHMKQVPGRKTDMRDAEWLADLCRHGLLTASFIPPAAIRQLRELTRYRTRQVQERTAELNRLQKTLESANIKLGAVASEVWGASGQAMLTALVQGEDDPAVLANLAQGTLRDKLEALAQALEGRVRPYHRVLIAQIMRHIRFLEEAIATLDGEIAQAAAPFEAAVRLLLPVPGFAVVSARAILAEIGVDMDRFPSAAHLASWAGVSPGNIILASGPDAAQAGLEPVFAALGQRTVWLGPAGRGSRMKLVANTLLAFEVEAVAEVGALAARLEVPYADLLKVIAGGPLESPFAMSKLAKMERSDHSADFSLEWALKDLNLALAASGAETAPVVAAIVERWRRLVANGHGGLDVSAARLGLDA